MADSEADKFRRGAHQAVQAAGGFLAEFRQFVRRGNVLDLAVGVIIGAAFGKIVSSLVADVLMPILGLALGGVKLADLKVVIGGTAESPIIVHYGNFLQATFDFLVIAFGVFVLVKVINALHRPPAGPDGPKEPGREAQLLAEIRDLLQAQADRRTAV
jgi:large conductance mechanosensitive channel